MLVKHRHFGLDMPETWHDIQAEFLGSNRRKWMVGHTDLRAYAVPCSSDAQADRDAELEAARKALRVALERYTTGDASAGDLLAAGTRFDLACIAAGSTEPPPYGTG